VKLQEYSANPPTRFWGPRQTDFHIGIELEVEAPNEEAFDKGLNLAGNRQRLCYAKRDGSLGSHGWELVTHPIASKLWLKKEHTGPLRRLRWLVGKLHEMEYTSHTNGRCGLHVHASNTAFRGGNRLVACRVPNGPWGDILDYQTSRYFTGYIKGFRREHRPPPHLYWYYRLVNGELFKKISQRAIFEFCHRRPQVKSMLTMREYDNHHEAVCWMSRHNTVETRIFRGNLRWERVMKAVQAVLAGIEFTRGLTSRNWGDNIDRSFVKFVHTHKELYPDLWNYFLETRCAVSSDSDETAPRGAIQLQEVC
jgi:hypothetical protein